MKAILVLASALLLGQGVFAADEQVPVLDGSIIPVKSLRLENSKIMATVTVKTMCDATQAIVVIKETDSKYWVMEAKARPVPNAAKCDAMSDVDQDIAVLAGPGSSDLTVNGLPVER